MCLPFYTHSGRGIKSSWLQKINKLIPRFGFSCSDDQGVHNSVILWTPPPCSISWIYKNMQGNDSWEPLIPLPTESYTAHGLQFWCIFRKQPSQSKFFSWYRFLAGWLNQCISMQPKMNMTAHVLISWGWWWWCRATGLSCIQLLHERTKGRKEFGVILQKIQRYYINVR